MRGRVAARRHTSELLQDERKAGDGGHRLPGGDVRPPCVGIAGREEGSSAWERAEGRRWRCAAGGLGSGRAGGPAAPEGLSTRRNSRRALSQSGTNITPYTHVTCGVRRRDPAEGASKQHSRRRLAGAAAAGRGSGAEALTTSNDASAKAERSEASTTAKVACFAEARLACECGIAVTDEERAGARQGTAAPPAARARPGPPWLSPPCPERCPCT